MQENDQSPESPLQSQEPQAKPETKKLPFAARATRLGLRCVVYGTLVFLAIALLFQGVNTRTCVGAPRSEHDAWLAKQAMIAQAAEQSGK